MLGMRLTQTENEKQRHARTCYFLDSHRRLFCNSIRWSAPSQETTARQASTHFGEIKTFRQMWREHKAFRQMWREQSTFQQNNEEKWPIRIQARLLHYTKIQSKMTCFVLASMCQITTVVFLGIERTFDIIHTENLPCQMELVQIAWNYKQIIQTTGNSLSSFHCSLSAGILRGSAAGPCSSSSFFT